MMQLKWGFVWALPFLVSFSAYGGTDTVLVIGGAALSSGWVSLYNPYNDLDISQFGVLSSNARQAILGASRTSDAPASIGSSIGGVFFGINDRPDWSQSWGAYIEQHRLPGNVGANYGLELDYVNEGTTIDVTPQNIQPGGGATEGIWIACGNGLNLPHSGSGPCSAAVAIGTSTNNKVYTPHRKGIVYQSTGLDPSVGAGGNGVAMELAPGQSIRWVDPVYGTIAELYGLTLGGLHISTYQTMTKGIDKICWSDANHCIWFDNNGIFQHD